MPFVNMPVQSPQVLCRRFCGQSFLQGLYNSITVAYSPVGLTGTPSPHVHNGDIRFLEGPHHGGFANSNPSFFIQVRFKL